MLAGHRRAVPARIRAALYCLVAVACVARQAGVGPDEHIVATVTVSPPSASISVDVSLQLAATARDSAGDAVNGPTFTWSSNAPAVATVDGSGTVTGRGAGTATITATSGGKSGSAVLTVTSVAVSSVSVTPVTPSVLVGMTVQLTATPRDAAGNELIGRVITWRSNDSARASVSPTGLVTGRVIGTATITATAEGRSGSATVSVTQVPVATVEVTPTVVNLFPVGTQQLTATARDASGAVLSRPITWQSSDTTKVRVSAFGLVTGVAVGSALITATCEGKSATASVSVATAPVATVTVAPSSSTVTAGNTVQLTATLKDANGTTLTGRTIVWTSSDPAKAQVNSTGLVLGLGAGSMTITATSEGKSGTASVTVNAVPVATVTVTPNPASVQVGATVQLAATLKDASGNVLTGRSVTWTSSHPTTRAQVSTSGLVTGVGAGTATITATSEGKSGTASVTVTQVPVASVTVTPNPASVQSGSTVQLTATLRDASGALLTGRTVTWTTSDATKALVSTSGQVVGVAAGSASITATSEGQSGSSSVTVTAPPAGTVLFSESFDDNLFASRGWYDLSTTLVSTTEKHAGTGSLEARWSSGATTTTTRTMRKLFTPTETLYISYWVKYSTNYVGSGKPYHPHEFTILSSLDGDWDGPSWNYLNTYIEQNYQNGGYPRIVIQDSRMIDITKIGVNLTGVTENRSLAGCNGNTDGTGVTSCYQVSGTEWYNAKEWTAPAVGFQPTAGPDYKGDWNHVEVYLQLNSIVGGIGQTNGIVRYWLNGNLKLEHTNIVFRTGANPTLKFKQFFFSPYIGDGSPAAQTMWVDDLTVGTAKP